jgi:hypothetical protein
MPRPAYWNMIHIKQSQDTLVSPVKANWRVGGKKLRESNGRGWMDQNKVDSRGGAHWETPWNIDLDINNKGQDYKIGTVCV